MTIGRPFETPHGRLPFLIPVPLPPDLQSADRNGRMGKMDFWRGGRSGIAAAGPAPSNNVDEALLLMQSFEESRQGWFWSTDDGGRLTYLSRGISEAPQGVTDSPP